MTDLDAPPSRSRALLELLGHDDPRIPLFIEQYGGGETAPEAFASCAGGTTDPDGTGSASHVAA